MQSRLGALLKWRTATSGLSLGSPSSSLRKWAGVGAGSPEGLPTAAYPVPQHSSSAETWEPQGAD
jgi:hypothetical protein